MKRQTKRIFRTLKPAEQAELARLRDLVSSEKEEIIARGRELRKEFEAAKDELSRTADLLKAERDRQGLSLAEMQKRTGISRAALCRLENLVDANPTIATLNRIAEALGKRLFVGLGE